MARLSATMEIADALDADQFQFSASGQSLTEFACGYFACLIAKSLAPVGQPPALTRQQIIDQAEAWYAKDHGNNLGSNTDGMTLQEEYDLLTHLSMHFQALPLDMNIVKDWITIGYPVLVAVVETSVHDIALGGNPYPWNPVGNHVILLTGIASDGNLLVRDSANCTSLYDPNSLRPGPRRYDASQLELVTATIVVPHWLPRPQGQAPQEGFIMPVPQGWKDVNGKLTAPNNHYLVLGFRDEVLKAASWDAGNVPLMEEEHVSQIELHNPPVAGSRQCMRDCMLVYSPQNGVHTSAAGAEIKACYDRIKALEAENAGLKAEEKKDEVKEAPGD